MTRWRPLAGSLAGLVCLAVIGSPGSGAAQGVRSLSLACAGGSQTALPVCQEAILGVQAAQGGLGLAASAGNDLPGSASTLGWRFKGSPRYSLGIRGSAVRTVLPEMAPGAGAAGGEDRVTLGSVQGQFAAGVFDGFSIAPTLGGILSLDVSGSGYLLASSGKKELDPARLGWGFGARLGIVRESFSAPGVSVSAYYRSLGESGLGDPGGGEWAWGTFDLAATSIRGVMGKDVMGLGLFVGAGWDRYSGDLAVTVVDSPPGSPEDPEFHSVSGALASERRMVFFGGTLTYLVLQVSLEGGWGEGFDPALSDGDGPSFDPNQGSAFGSLSFRLTF